MKNYEAFLKIREKISEEERRIPALETELVSKQRAQTKLNDEGVKAEMLEEKGRQAKKQAAEENEEAALRVKEELEKLKRKLEFMKTNSASATEAALGDLREHYRAASKPLVLELVKSLRAALETEKQLVSLADEANGKRTLVTPYPRIVCPIIWPLLLNPAGVFKEGPFDLWLRRVKEEGFDVDGVGT